MYNREETERHYLDLILSGEYDEGDISEIISMCEYEREEGDDNRWDRYIFSVVKVCGRYFSVEWSKGLTEMQEDDYYGSKFVEVTPHTYQKTITVTEWIPKEN